MAENAIKKLEEQLNCAICLDTFSNPKQLQCNHVYCQDCLVKLARATQSQQFLTCPHCRQITPVPASGVAGLQTAFHINYLLEIKDSVKKANTLTPSDARLCAEHSKCLKLYCEVCNELICVECAIRGGKHQSHDYSEVSQAFDKYRQEMILSLKPMEEYLTNINQTLAQLDTRNVEVLDQQKAIEMEISSSIKRIQDILEGRKTGLIYLLNQFTQDKLESLAAQREQLESTQAQLSHCIKSIRESLETKCPEDTLLKTKQVKEMTTMFKPTPLSEPDVEADIIFSASSYVKDIIRDFGDIVVPSLPDPSKCSVTGKGFETAVVGEAAVAVVEILDFKRDPCKQLVKSLKCEITSKMRGTSTECSVGRIGENQYQMVYRPTIKGGHELSIEVEGEHIKGSPFQLTVKSVGTLGNPVQVFEGMNAPRGVTINHKGELVVTEWMKHSISLYSPSGKKLHTFDTKKEAGKMRLDGVAVTTEGKILVPNYFDVCMFSSEGELLSSARSKGHASPLKFPVGITFNARSNKVYVSDDSHCVHILNSDLSFVKSFGKEGKGKGEFSFPRGVACNSSGEVLVADSNNDRIQVFSPKGKFLRIFGKGNRQIQCPYGVAIDSNDTVYISNRNTISVSIFSPEGQLITSFGKYGKAPGEFSLPVGIAVDSHGVVYVCDCNNNRIQVF